jgi:predicted DNA-binding transcriptional regulator YafY
MQRTERLFALTEYLRGRRTGVTAEVLAERFGVTLRTIYRDLDTLRMAALPLSAERGRGGGYALDRSYSLPPVNFTAREAALLVALGRFAIEMRLLPFAETLDSALDKVRAALSTSAQRELLTRLSELSFHGVPGLPTKKAVRSALERAWFEQCPLRIVYVDGNFIQSTRTIRIVGVLMERRETRLDAVDLDSGERRHWRLDRIEQAEVVRLPPPAGGTVATSAARQSPSTPGTSAARPRKP